MEQKSAYAEKAFWIGTLDRALATLGQSAVVFLTAGVTGILEVDGIQLFSVVALSVVASIATSIAYPTRVIKGEPEVIEQEVEKEVRRLIYERIDQSTVSFSEDFDPQIYTTRKARIAAEKEGE